MGRLPRSLLSGVCFAVGAILLLPLVWTLSLSIRTGGDVFSNRLLPHSFRIANFEDAWNSYDLGILFWHSAVVAVGTVVITTALAAAASFGFARYRSRLTEALFILILTGLMVPPVAIIIPFFVAMSKVGLYGSLWSVILGESVFALPFSVLLLRGYIESIPADLTDAALVDGASQWQSFWYVAVPLLKPALATVALFTMISAWNDFLLPLVLLNNASTATLTVGLSASQAQFGALDLQLISAAAVLAIIPVLAIFVAARRYYVQGLAAGAIKQ